MGSGQAGIGRRVIWVQENRCDPGAGQGRDTDILSCGPAELLWPEAGRETLAASLRKYRPCQADPCLRTESKTGKVKRKEAEGTARMRLLLSSQSSAVGKSPKANAGVRRHAQGRLQHLPHLPCREAGQGGAAQMRVRGRATPRATQASCGSPTPSLGALLGRGEEGSRPLPGWLVPFLPVDHFHFLSQDVSGARRKPEAV